MLFIAETMFDCYQLKKNVRRFDVILWPEDHILHKFSDVLRLKSAHTSLGLGLQSFLSIFFPVARFEQQPF